MSPPHPRYEPIMVPPRRPGRWRSWAPAVLGGLLIVWGLVTVGQALHLDADGVRTRAEVVDAEHGGRSDFVRVRIDSGRELNLWAWSGAPEVGETLTVVHLEDRSRAKDVRVFAPAFELWGALGMGLWFLVGGTLVERRRARRRAEEFG